MEVTLSATSTASPRRASISIAPVTSSAPLLLKCDIEGAERQLFLHIRDWEHLIRYIFLELHTEFLPVEEMLACLASSGFEWTIHGTPSAGAGIALLLLERGERRNRQEA